MCEKPSNYLVLESQFSNGLKLFIVLLSTSRAQPKTKKLQWRQRWRGVLLHTAAVGYRARAGVVNSFPTEYYSNTAVFCCWQTTSHSQTSVCCCRSVQNSFGVDRAVPAARAPRGLAAVPRPRRGRGRRPSSLQPIHSRTECLVHLFIRNNQKH